MLFWLFCFSSCLSCIMVVVVGSIRAPQRCPRPNAQKLWIGYLTWWKNFADVIKRKILRLRDSPEFSGWAPWNHKGPSKRETRGSKSEKEMWWQKQSEVWRCYAAGFENAGRDHPPKGCGELLEAGRSKGMDSPPPLEPPKGRWPCQHLSFSQVKPILNFWPLAL